MSERQRQRERERKEKNQVKERDAKRKRIKETPCSDHTRRLLRRTDLDWGTRITLVQLDGILPPEFPQSILSHGPFEI